TRDQAFRVHHGQTLTGELHWGTVERPSANRRDLRGTYNLMSPEEPSWRSPPGYHRKRWSSARKTPPWSRVHGGVGAACQNRTDDLVITSSTPPPESLVRQFGSRVASVL